MPLLMTAAARKFYAASFCGLKGSMREQDLISPWETRFKFLLNKLL